jgi:hypothetical protein
MLLMHGVPFDTNKITGTYPKDKDGCDISPKIYLERARKLSAQMTSFLAERNEKRAAAKARKRSTSGAPSSKATGSSAQVMCVFLYVMDNVVSPPRLCMTLEHYSL